MSNVVKFSRFYIERSQGLLKKKISIAQKLDVIGKSGTRSGTSAPKLVFEKSQFQDNKKSLQLFSSVMNVLTRCTRGVRVVFARVRT